MCVGVRKTENVGEMCVCVCVCVEKVCVCVCRESVCVCVERKCVFVCVRERAKKNEDVRVRERNFHIKEGISVGISIMFYSVLFLDLLYCCISHKRGPIL